MKKKCKLLIVRLVGFYCFLCIGSLEGEPLQIEVSARSGILINAKTGAILWEKKPYEPVNPASTTKIITALVAYEKMKGELNKKITAPFDAVHIVPAQVRRSQHPPYRLEHGGTSMGIRIGEELPFLSLLHGLLLCSGNDAANVIAHHVSGSVPAFVEEMNAFVQSKGCKNTKLYTPHGLPHKEHVTTAYDMALLARCFLEQEGLREIVSLVSAPRPETNKQPESVLLQHNGLVRPGKFYYPKAKGIKLGYTIDAGFCMVSAAEDENRDLILVLMGCSKKEQFYQELAAVFDVAFQEKKKQRLLFSKGFEKFTHDYPGGKSSVQAVLNQDVSVSYYPSEEPKWRTSVVWESDPLPVYQGQKVGSLLVWDGERLLSSTPIEASKEVPMTWRYQMSRHLGEIQGVCKKRSQWILAGLGIGMITGVGYLSHNRAKRARK